MFAKRPARAAVVALCLAAITIVALAIVLPVAAKREGHDVLSGVRASTERYQDLAAAKADGYALLTDAAGIACIDNPGSGAMGVHYANGKLVEVGVVDGQRPQVLVYEPTAEGGLKLAGVEYVIFQEGWDATHRTPPSLFGQEFMLTPAGNRYGLPAFYALHAWVWQSNPSGTFAMWNPQVRCQ